MASIRIVTDSTAGLSEEVKAELGIVSVPLIVRFGSESFREGIDITNEEFYRRLTTRPDFPSTSQPSAGDFQEVYRELAKTAGSIISIHISSKISGTCQSALTALQDESIGVRVDVVDSLSVAIGLAHMVIVAARMAKDGADRESILTAAGRLIPRNRIGFAVETLEYLRRGGRIGGAQAFLGSLLRIKPVLHLEEGRVEPLDRARSTKKAVDRLLRFVDEESDGGPLEYCGVMHVRNQAGARQLRELLAARFEASAWYEGELSAVVGAHAGPGLVGVCFPAKER